MPKSQRLVKETYFVSPRYKNRTEQDTEERRLSTWLANNTHSLDYVGAGAVSYDAGRLMGENGVLCDIVLSHTYFENHHERAPFNVLVKVISSPAVKSLPWEIKDILLLRGYTESPPTFRLPLPDTGHPRIRIPKFFE